MKAKKHLKTRFKKAILGCFLVIIGVLGNLGGAVLGETTVFAEPVDESTVVDRGTTDENTVNENTNATDENNADSGDADKADTDSNKADEANTDGGANAVNNGNASLSGDNCQDALGSLGWLVCPTTGKIAEAADWLYDKIEEILVINPISVEDGTPIYEIWKYCRGVTNIVFIIFLLVVIYSQLTGVGISNYGIKKALPKLIITAILVNLSFLICSLAVDVSNIIGSSLRGVFTSVEESVLMANAGGATEMTAEMKLSYNTMYTSLASGTALAVGAGVVMFETGTIWMMIPVILGALVAVASGLITIALRQAVVALLIMISPLAMVAYILPNTEDWFKKWRKLFTRMLVFYPMFSLLFGASSLAGFAIISSAKDGFGVLLGTAVQIFPLFFSWSLMKMSGTFLGSINARLRGLAAKPLATNRAWADSHRQLTRARNLSSDKGIYTPSRSLMRFMENRKIARATETKELGEDINKRGVAYYRGQRYSKYGKRKGQSNRRGIEAAERVARGLAYDEVIARDDNNMEKGLSTLAVNKNSARLAQLKATDNRLVVASDRLKMEKARGELIEYENAVGFHNRMEAAVNAHFDDVNAGVATYRKHDMSDADRAAARARYSALSKIMEGDAVNAQYAAATAAQAYDTQKKIVDAKWGKYFELTPPTKDVEFRLNELTKTASAISNIDAIIDGMRVLNQRGDTDLVKQQLDNVLAQGVQLGTHASQSLASFLMFEVKDNDPFLRRFGKYINLETARAYNANERKVMNVTYDEYVKGYHEGEEDLIDSQANPTGRMYAKKGMKQLVEGTSLDNIERTALSNLDDSLKKAYGYDENDKSKAWDVSGWLKKRNEIQTAFEPAFISASLKWLSGSEQINSGVKFWTGYELKQKKEEVDINGKKTKQVVTDSDGNPVYEWAPVWNEGEFAGNEKQVKDYFQDKTMAYLKDQTPSQILGMRSDYRDAVMEHLIGEYFDNNPGAKEAYDNEVARIQTLYGDKDINTAKKLRSADIKKMKMDLAGKQMRKILGKTGKLEQIYRTRRSGAANNAKDWLREWVSLDNEKVLYEEVDYYRRKQMEEWEQEMQRRKEADPSFDYQPAHKIYDESDQARFVAEMSDINDKYGDEDVNTFFEATKNKLGEWFADDYIVWSYEKYYKDNKNADNEDLYTWIKNVLDDLDQYPGNRDKK